VGGQKLVTLACVMGDNGLGCPGGNQYNVYFGGKLVKSKGLVVAADRLGSVRANSNGERMSYYPYGEERTSTADDREKFGTYTRDNPYQDYADQRYYAPWGGRFLTPDPGGVRTAVPTGPASWNRYAYVSGDPVNFNDPTGRLQADPSTDINSGLYCSSGIELLIDGMPDGCYGEGGGGDGDGASSGDEGDDEESPWECPVQYQNFINAHASDAAATGLSQANVLATSAIESGWGGGRFAQLGNSFFNLETLVPAPAPGTELTLPPNKYAYQLSWVPALEAHTSGPDKGKLSLVASYNSAADSFKSFAATLGSFLSGVTDAATFASRLVAHGINAGRDENFANTVQTFQDCLNAQKQ